MTCCLGAWRTQLESAIDRAEELHRAAEDLFTRSEKLMTDARALIRRFDETCIRERMYAEEHRILTNFLAQPGQLRKRELREYLARTDKYAYESLKRELSQEEQ